MPLRSSDNNNNNDMNSEVRKATLPRGHATSSPDIKAPAITNLETDNDMGSVNIPESQTFMPVPTAPAVTKGMKDLALHEKNVGTAGEGYGRYMKYKRRFEDDDLQEISESQFKRARNESRRSLQELSNHQFEPSNHNSQLSRHRNSTAINLRSRLADPSDVINLDSDQESRRPSAVTTLSQDTSIPDLVDESDDEVTVTSFRAIGRPEKKKVCPKILDSTKIDAPSAMQNGVQCRPGLFVELRDGTFMSIVKIYRDKTHGHVLIGTIFIRVGSLSPVMPIQRNATEWKAAGDRSTLDTRLPLSRQGHSLVNELVQKIKVGSGEEKADYGLWRRPIQDVVRKRDLILTNSYYEDVCITTQHARFNSNMEDTASLICRWKEIVEHGENGKWKEQRLERVSEREASHLVKTQTQLEESWCIRNHTNATSGEQSITFADAFCRAGGVSAGAQQAGLDIKYAFDCDENKIATHKMNFPRCRSSVMDVSEFISWANRQQIQIHVLHLSPPCQPFSNANTTPNEQKNERNQPPLLACGEVIKALKPRIVTVEEAPGIASRHSEWFHALLNQFTELGFSLRWTNLKCADFGVPQQRRRFMIIAAAPGETLPPFPEPTHGPGDCSVARTLAELERVHGTRPLTRHDTRTMLQRAKPPYDANCLAKTITTSGGDNYHPSGRRQFTVREYAALQTFPWAFEFGRYRDGREFTVAELRTQIGNAVPPFVAKAVFGSVVRSLRESDERKLAPRTREGEVVVIEDQTEE